MIRYKAYKVPPALVAEDRLKCQLSVAIFSSAGTLISATDEAITFYLWAPTAQSVHVLIYGDAAREDPLEIVQFKETNGVWTACGPRSWKGCYYVYEVYVYHPSTLQIERCLANDPYARGLSADGKRTLSPLVSFLYERSWRQNFNCAGFPGPDEEVLIAVTRIMRAEVDSPYDVVGVNKNMTIVGGLVVVVWSGCG
ncbi:Pullulanase 1 chloroplastic-like [Heracleum sosnowskyi]|uniref:Pullulanase 1 chloroplastic-like n=1 Tax=Heracleum sosnowskyi TaxID=360622 RepID=A0AAD8HLU8_9APIA|nr:Pullulanase 1 chloroplastic-like [Heracleum sosnowskyi]